MVVADVEEAVTFEPEWLVYLEVETDVFHFLTIFMIIREGDMRLCSVGYYFLIDVNYFFAGFLPGDAFDFFDTVVAQLVV